MPDFGGLFKFTPTYTPMASTPSGGGNALADIFGSAPAANALSGFGAPPTSPPTGHAAVGAVDIDPAKARASLEVAEPTRGSRLASTIGSVIGTIAAIPGFGAMVGAIADEADLQAARDYVQAHGLPPDVISREEATKASMSFGAKGLSPADQVDDLFDHPATLDDVTLGAAMNNTLSTPNSMSRAAQNALAAGYDIGNMAVQNAIAAGVFGGISTTHDPTAAAAAIADLAAQQSASAATMDALGSQLDAAVAAGDPSFSGDDGTGGNGGGYGGADPTGGGAAADPGSTGCFVAGTQVLLADGVSTKAIEELKEGDQIAAFTDMGDLETGTVVATMAFEDREVFEFHGVRCTPDHPFLTVGLGDKPVFRPIGQLKAGNVLLDAQGRLTKKGRTTPAGRETVHNITVSPQSVYVIVSGAASFRVHNKLAKGGHVTREHFRGPNPPGPDDGFVALDEGEFVIRRSVADELGPNLLAALNEGRVNRNVLAKAVRPR